MPNYRMHYSKDSAALAVDAQFFFGSSILVSPVTQQGATSVEFYLPKDIFYDLFTQTRVQTTGTKVTYNNLSTADIPVHIKGGSILPMRIESANTTTALRTKDFELVIAPNADGNAKGSLYLDDGVSIEQGAISEIEFSFDNNTISADGSFAFDAGVKVKSVTLLGEGEAAKYELNENLSRAWKHNVGSLKKIGS